VSKRGNANNAKKREKTERRKPPEPTVESGCDSRIRVRADENHFALFALFAFNIGGPDSDVPNWKQLFSGCFVVVPGLARRIARRRQQDFWAGTDPVPGDPPGEPQEDVSRTANLNRYT
jgi:hypothetical protein